LVSEGFFGPSSDLSSGYIDVLELPLPLSSAETPHTAFLPRTRSSHHAHAGWVGSMTQLDLEAFDELLICRLADLQRDLHRDLCSDICADVRAEIARLRTEVLELRPQAFDPTLAPDEQLVCRPSGDSGLCLGALSNLDGTCELNSLVGRKLESDFAAASPPVHPLSIDDRDADPDAVVLGHEMKFSPLALHAILSRQ